MWYYIKEGKTFINNLEEYHRVLKKDGYVIATLSALGISIFRYGIDKGGGHIKIKNDIFNLRNDDALKCFYSEKDIPKNLEPFLKK